MKQTTSNRKFRNIRNSAVAVLAIAGVVAAPAAANASTARVAPVSVSIQPEVGGFFGYVSSSKSKCETTKVTLYKSNGQKIGSDLAQPNGPDGQWFVSTNMHGKFYAKAKGQKGCAEAYSETVRAEQG